MRWPIFVLGAVLCWGMYGPALHAGQTTLKSPVRALLWVGIAYFLIAVLFPAGYLASRPDSGEFNVKGSVIATLAGGLGALGAVCIILAFKSGGTPAYVMPLVFGGAPFINAMVSMALHPPKTAPNPAFYLGLLCAGLGAFLILRFKPA